VHPALDAPVSSAAVQDPAIGMPAQTEGGPSSGMMGAGTAPPALAQAVAPIAAAPLALGNSSSQAPPPLDETAAPVAASSDNIDPGPSVLHLSSSSLDPVEGRVLSQEDLEIGSVSKQKEQKRAPRKHPRTRKNKKCRDQKRRRINQEGDDLFS